MNKIFGPNSRNLDHSGKLQKEVTNSNVDSTQGPKLRRYFTTFLKTFTIGFEPFT